LNTALTALLRALSKVRVYALLRRIWGSSDARAASSWASAMSAWAALRRTSSATRKPVVTASSMERRTVSVEVAGR